VRQETAGFNGKKKPRRNYIPPLLKGLLFREAVKGIIDLNRVKLSRVPGEHLRSRKPLRVEIANPVLVMPSRGADVD
jgi:hypothetical protein